MLKELQCVSYNDMIHKDTEQISTFGGEKLHVCK